MAMVMLNVGILAIVAAFNAGAVALRRANRIATGSALADAQMERYRGLAYSAIEFDDARWTAAKTDSTYTADPVYQTIVNSSPQKTVPTVTGTPCAGSPVPASCDPSRQTTGADHRTYRVDTYIYYDTPSGGGTLKTVAVVVRDANNLSRTLARESSTFDPSTGNLSP
jgi:hypothetical protein